MMIVGEQTIVILFDENHLFDGFCREDIKPPPLIQRGNRRVAEEIIVAGKIRMAMFENIESNEQIFRQSQWMMLMMPLI